MMESKNKINPELLERYANKMLSERLRKALTVIDEDTQEIVELKSKVLFWKMMFWIVLIGLALMTYRFLEDLLHAH